MPVQLSSEEGLPETAVKANKRWFRTLSVIFKIPFMLLSRPIKREVKFNTSLERWSSLLGKYGLNQSSIHHVDSFLL